MGIAFFAIFQGRTMIFKITGPPFSINVRNLFWIPSRSHCYCFVCDLGVARVPVGEPVSVIFDTKQKEPKKVVRVYARARCAGWGGCLTIEQLSTQGDAFQHQFTPTVPKGMVAD